MSEIDDILKGAPEHKPGAVATKAAAPAPTSEIDQALKDAPAPARGFGGWARDIAATAVKGAIAVPEAVVGLADIPTGGAVGKFLENEGGAVGFRPKQAKEIVNDWHSDATKQAQQKFQEAEGLGGKLQAAVENPSVIATTVGESLPSMFAGGALAKGVGLAAPALAGRAGLAAAGEGAMMAGSQAESIRQQTEDGLLTGKQAALAAATGLAGGAISALGARAGKALGVGDVDTMIAGGATQGVARDGLGIASRAGRGALAEGVLEELPQSLAETALGNIALGKDVTEGMDEAAVLGTLSGGLMGGAAGAMSRPGAAQAQTTPQAQAGAQAFTAGQPMTPPAELNSVTEKAQWVKGWQDAAAASMGLDGESADQQPVQTAGDVLPDVPGGMATVQRTYDPRAGQRPPLATMSADVGGNGMDFEPSPEFDRNIRTFDPLKENEPTKGLGYNPLAGTPTVYPDGSVALNGDQEFQYRTGAVAPQKRSEQMGLNPSAGPMSAAAATAVDTGAADQVQQQAVLAQAAEAAAKAQKGKAPAADPAAEPASPAKRVAHRVTGFMNGDPASPVRTMVMASSQEEALDLAAKSSPGMVPDRAEPVSSKVKAGQTTTQPATGAPNRVLETAQTVQTGQEEPKAPAAAAGVGAASAADARTDEQATTATTAAKAVEPAATGRTGVSGVDQPQPLGALSNVQNTPISTAGTEAQASPVEARAPEGGNAAAAGGVPAAGGNAGVRADGVGNGPGSDAGNGFKRGPQDGERYRVGVVDSVGGAVSLEKRLPAGTSATFYVGKDGGLVDGESVNLIGPGREKLWIPTSKDAADQATVILDEMGKLALSDPNRADLKKRLKQLVTGAGDVQADGVKAATIAEAAHQAATSPKNDLPQPTEAQKEAGNYQKGHARIAGHDVTIENPAGSKRRPEWPALKNHYGYFKGSVGADKDHVDVFMTDLADDESLPVFVVDQVNKDGTFDEHKVVMGAADEAEARATYLQNYEKGWAGLGAITQMSQVDFKAWVRDPAKTKRPAGKIQAKAGDALPTATAPEHVVVGVDDRVPDQKQAEASKFSTVPEQPAQSVSVEKAQEVADKALSSLGLNGVVSIRAFSKASDAGIATPDKVIPMGATSDGRIFLFAENLADELAVFRTVFHELFHLGLSKTVPQGAYIQTMLGFLTDPLVRQYANRWKQTEDGVSRKGTMPVNNWQALAVEEALSDIAEDMNADRDGTGTRYAAWAGRMASRLAKLADGVGLKTVAERIRAFTRTEAEQFVQDVMRRAGDAAPVQLRGQRFSQSQEAPDILSQDNSLDASAASDATGTVYTPATEAHQKAATAFAERLSKGRDSFVLMDAIRPSGARKQEAQSVANLAKAMFGREVVFVKFKGRPLFNGAVSTTDPGKVFVNIESARPMMAVLGHELLHELRKSNPAAYNQLAKTLKTVTKDDYIYEALLKKKYRDQGLNWTPQDISEELYGDIVGDNFMDPKFWEAIAGEKPVFAKQLYRAVMNWLNKIAAMFNRMKVRQDGSMVLTLAEQADGSRPFGTQKYLQDIEAARDAVAQAMGQFGKAKPQGQTDALSIADAAEQIKAFDVKSAPKSAWAHYRGMVLQALGRRQLVDLYAEELPQLETYNDLVQQMDAEKNDTGAEADRVAQDWGSLKGGMDRKLAELMHDATLAKMDPDKPMPAGYFKRDYDVLKARFDALSPEAKVLYRKARDMYLDHYKAVQQAIKDRVERSEMSEGQKRKMMADLDDKLFKELKGVYFPLARFGQYVIVVKDANGEVVNVTRAETVKEAEQARKELQKAFPASSGNTVGKVLKQAEFNAGRDAVGKGFMADLMNTLDAKGVDDELRDTVAQLYLSSLPDLSWAKHGIHRKGTPGFSQDARRAFAQNMFHGARYLAKLRHADRLQDLLIEMQDHIKAYEGVEEYDSVQAQQVVDEMVKRHEWLMNPKASPVSTALTSFGFLFHMGLSPASAMVNLTQTALVAYPQMGAKWGFARAGAALTKASEETVRAKNDLSQVLKGDELDAFNRAVKDGTIDVTMAHDLAGIAQGEDQGVMWKIRPVMRWASFMFHHAEKFNRQATFLAAYRLAKEANPAATQSQLYEQAKQATYDGHFDYSSSNRARIMQGNWQRVIFLFKQYAQSMVYTLARNAYQSVKALDPKERSQARKTLAGILAAHAAAAGVLGLPIVGPLLTVASWIGGDDDEPWDAEVAMQNAMAETIGPKAAEVVARGFSRLTPFDLSGRVALNKLILPDVQEGLEGKEWAESAMAAALGPVAGIGVNMARGAQKITEGHYMRGLEDMMPTALRGPLKAVRYASEGAVDKTRVVITDEVSVAGVLGQASGFAPSQVRRDTERRSAIYAYDRALTDRRSVLMRMFADAQMSGDSETVQEIRKDIAAFNEKNPTRRITLPNLMQSVRDRQRRIDQAEDGVYLPKNRRDAQEAVTF